MGFHQPPSTILFDDPPFPNDNPYFHHVYIKRCVKDAEMITWKHLAQFIGQKELFKKNLRGAATTSPSDDEG